MQKIFVNKTNPYPYINCRSLTSHWEEFKELQCNIGSDNFMFDFIGITEVFEMRDHLKLTLDGYHRLQYNTRPNIVSAPRSCYRAQISGDVLSGCVCPGDTSEH